MSVTAPIVRGPAPQTPSQPTSTPAPTTVAEAIAALHDTAGRLDVAIEGLHDLWSRYDQCPEMRTVIINPGNNGVYRTVDDCPWASKSLGVLNVGAAPVFIGVGGVSAQPSSRAPSCPGASALVLPVECAGIEFGCDPAVLGGGTAVIYVFRYVAVQPLRLGEIA